MKALAAFDWGVKLLFTFPGYPEWLIDRRTELTKEGKIEKFEVVKAIVQNSFAKTSACRGCVVCLTLTRSGGRGVPQAGALPAGGRFLLEVRGTGSRRRQGRLRQRDV